jgi:hypothetical protein
VNLKCHALWPRRLSELAAGGGYINRNNGSLLNNNRPLSPCTHSLFLQSTIASNDNKCKQEDTEEESTTEAKWLRLFGNDDDDNSFGESSEEMEAETEAEDISSEEELMNQPDSSEEKLMC